MSGTFKNIDHSTSGGLSGAASSEVDLRPLIVAIRELTARIGGGSLDPAEPMIITQEPAVVHVTVPEQKPTPVTVTLPEMQPEIVINVPETVPQVTVSTSIPTWPLILIGLTNIVTLLLVLKQVFLRG